MNKWYDGLHKQYLTNTCTSNTIIMKQNAGDFDVQVRQENVPELRILSYGKFCVTS